MDIHQMERPVGAIEFSLGSTEIVILKKYIEKLNSQQRNQQGTSIEMVQKIAKYWTLILLKLNNLKASSRSFVEVTAHFWVEIIF